MELIDVIARAHFDNPKVGAVTRKQRLRIGKDLAAHLAALDLIEYVNPPKTEVKEYPKTVATDLGGDEPSTSSQPDQALPSETATVFRRGRRRKTDASSQ